MTSIALPGDVGQERHLARPLDRPRHLVLVATARARDAARADLALLGDVPAKDVDVLVVDVVDLRLAELAALAPRGAGLSAGSLAAALALCLVLCQSGLLRTECRRRPRPG